MRKLLKKHALLDDKRFNSMEKRFDAQDTILKEIKVFMENLQGVNDVVKGVDLLKKPAVWILAIVVGIVALFGGLKTILGWFIIK